MALVEDGLRQRLRQRFSHLPEPIFDECLRTNASNINLCITQLRERSQAQQSRDLMCGAKAGMDPAQYTQQTSPLPPPPQPPPPPHLQQRPDISQDGRLNSDGWFELTWPPKMNAGGDDIEQSSNRTQETNESTETGWRPYRDLYSFRPPLQVSKISVNLQESGNRAKSPGLVQPSTCTSPSRTYDAGNGSRTPGTPDSIGLESSIILPGISPPLRDRTPSPSVNPFFPPIDPNALRASQQSNGQSSPGVGYQYPRSPSPRHHSSNTSTPPTHYNSPIPGQPSVVTSHHVTPNQRITPEPRHQDVRRKTSQPERWAEPYQPRLEAHVSGVHREDSQAAPQSYPQPSQRPPTQGHESKEYRQRMGSQEEIRYNQALIMHQNARKDRLRKDFDEEQSKLEKMRSEIRSMEEDLNTKRSHRSHFPSNEQLSVLREEKRQLQIDIECMNKEIDMLKKQGYIDPQAFYANIEQGPTGPIPPGPPILPDPITPPVLDPDEGQQWSCTHCTFLNHPFLDKCECCEMPRDSA